MKFGKNRAASFGNAEGKMRNAESEIRYEPLIFRSLVFSFAKNEDQHRGSFQFIWDAGRIVCKLRGLICKRCGLSDSVICLPFNFREFFQLGKQFFGIDRLRDVHLKARFERERFIFFAGVSRQRDG